MMLVRVTNQSVKLAQAWWFTRDRKYAQRLATKLRTFFLDEETGMLPSLLYAQLKPGILEVGSSAVRVR
jgi:hypothetical protein